MCNLQLEKPFLGTDAGKIHPAILCSVQILEQRPQCQRTPLGHYIAYSQSHKYSGYGKWQKISANLPEGALSFLWGPIWAAAAGSPPPRGGRARAHLGPGPFGPSHHAGSRLSPMQGPCRAPCRVQVKPHIWAHLGSYGKVSAPPIPPETLVYEKIPIFWPLATSRWHMFEEKQIIF